MQEGWRWTVAVEVVGGDYRRAVQEGVHHLHKRVWRVRKVSKVNSKVQVLKICVV